MDNCHDCGAAPGTPHIGDCDTARCLYTGMQRLQCPGCHHDCGQDVWTGEWPGTAECRQYGLWVYCPPTGSPVPCGPEHPDAVADVTALVRSGRWDREAQRWVLLDSPVR